MECKSIVRKHKSHCEKAKLFFLYSSPQVTYFKICALYIFFCYKACKIRPFQARIAVAETENNYRVICIWLFPFNIEFSLLFMNQSEYTCMCVACACRSMENLIYYIWRSIQNISANQSWLLITLREKNCPVKSTTEHFHQCSLFFNLSVTW